MTDTTHDAVLKAFGGQGFGPFKSALADLLVAKLTPISQETNRLLGDETALIDILRTGAERAAEIADPIVSEAERLVGFVGLKAG